MEFTIKKFRKIYIEITNVCNLSCSFCSPMKREPRFISIPEFQKIISQIKPFTDYIYLHVKGEPLMHENLGEFLDIAHDNGLQVNITTNGTMLKNNLEMLCTKPALRQLNVSLHSIENDTLRLDDYMNDIVFSIKELSIRSKAYLVMRLWNLGKIHTLPKSNQHIIEILSEAFGIDILNEIKSEDKLRSITLGDKTYLSHDEEFEWPNLSNEFYSKFGFCYGLNRMVAILVDGTVTPCCLDADGVIALGNIYSQNFADIILSERASTISKRFSERKAAEELCRHCTYKKRFNRDLK